MERWRLQTGFCLKIHIGNNAVKKLIDAIRNYFIKKKQLTKEDIDSIVFSEEGQYGGNQGSPEIQTRGREGRVI